VRHGAEKRAAPTEIVVKAIVEGSDLKLSVWNAGNNLPAPVAANGVGTGLSRLRERLSVLYGDRAQLKSESLADGGYEATLLVPRGSKS
jgi:LytS/YehU family sensor histidine kinase